MRLQTTNEMGRPAGNEATHMQTDGHCAPACTGHQAACASLADAPCLCGIDAAGQCLTCERWMLAWRVIRARQSAARRFGR